MDTKIGSSEVILGVDTHLDLHVGVVIDTVGRVLATLAVPTRKEGYLQLLAWARSFGSVLRAGVEGTTTYGAGLTRLLRENDVQVYEVNRPDRSRRRLRGKSDPTDAENAARRAGTGGDGDPEGSVWRRRSHARHQPCAPST